MAVCLLAKFEVSSIILASFTDEGGGWGGILPPAPTQNEPLKNPLRLGLK